MLNKLADRPIGQRLYAVLGMVLLIAFVGSAIGYRALSRVAEQTQTMYAQTLVTERTAAEWYRNITNGVTRTSAIAISADASLAQFFTTAAAESTAASTELQKKLDALMTEPADRAAFAAVSDARKGYLSSRDAVSASKKAGDAEKARQIFDSQFQPAAANYQKVMLALAQLQRDKLDAAAKSVAETNASARTGLVVFALVALAVGAALAWWLTRSITTPLHRAVSVAEAIARLDLTHDIDAKGGDETGQLLRALKSMQAALVKLIGEVRASTDSIGTASTEISVGNHDLSARTEQTASNLQEAAASMMQLTSTVRQTADSAVTANQLAASASEVAQRGGSVVAQVVSTMDDISKSSHRISDIIGTIDGIAFQTNILALNAAVEAARAGEQGRGFAVVASEVRSLAQRSAEAAKEIKTLISASLERVESGTQQVQNAGTTMGEIVSSVQRVSDIIGEISAAAREQSDGIDQINAAVTQLDQMTQQNAALVEESAAAAESLKDQSSRLSDAISQFKLSHAAMAAKTVQPPTQKPVHKPMAKAALKPVTKTASAKPLAAKPAAPRAAAPKPAAPAPRAPAPATAAVTDEWESF